MTLLLVLIQYWEDHIIIYTNIRVHGLYNICASLAGIESGIFI